jgi:hypothetical protein
LISRALRQHAVEDGAVLLARLASIQPTTPLQISEAVCITLDWDGEVPESWVAELISSQASEGSWERLTFFVAESLRWGSTAVTTAMCVEALSGWLGS